MRSAEPRDLPSEQWQNGSSLSAQLWPTCWMRRKATSAFETSQILAWRRSGIFRVKGLGLGTCRMRPIPESRFGRVIDIYIFAVEWGFLSAGFRFSAAPGEDEMACTASTASTFRTADMDFPFFLSKEFLRLLLPWPTSCITILCED